VTRQAVSSLKNLIATADSGVAYSVRRLILSRTRPEPNNAIGAKEGNCQCIDFRFN
jgi:hypothetical protein